MFPMFSLFGSSIRLQPWFQVVQLAIRPLQGFFNLIIFLNHKVYNTRRRSSNMSICDALRNVFASKEEQEHIISTLMLVRHHHKTNEEHQSVEIVDMKDGTYLDNKGSSGKTSGNRMYGVGSENLSAPSG
eukprot:320015_1